MLVHLFSVEVSVFFINLFWHLYISEGPAFSYNLNPINQQYNFGRSYLLSAALDKLLKIEQILLIINLIIKAKMSDFFIVKFMPSLY